MTTDELIIKLGKLSNRQVKIVLDCPHCKKSTDLTSVLEIVIITGEK